MSKRCLSEENPMRRINFAMIGHGFMGKAHSYALLATPFFFKTGFEPVRKVIVGRNAEKAKQAAESFGWEEYSTDWREVVRRPDIDAVAIVTPPNTHLLRKAFYHYSGRGPTDGQGGATFRRKAHAWF